MSFRTKDGEFRVPREVDVPPTVTEQIRDRVIWKNRTLKRNNEKLFFDQDIRTGECFFCKRMGDAQKSQITHLHHVKYDNDDPLRWTIEVCQNCHIRIDERLQKKIDVRGFNERRRRQEYERRLKEPMFFNINGRRKYFTEEEKKRYCNYSYWR